jgi:hypothetical protein
MPAPKMFMQISNGNATSAQHANFNAKTALIKAAASTAPTSLNSSMISRIHNVKSGCGGCGRN